MRAFALHADAIVFVSDVWQTTSTAVRSGEEGFLIDSLVYPEELRALPDVLAQSNFPVAGLLCTHGDWDHLLGRLAYPQAPLGCPESTVERLNAHPGEAQRSLRAFDEEHYVDQRSPLALGGLQSLPAPGHLELGSEHELELHAADGHTPDGAAYWLPWLKVLVCGDYLSPVEIPMISEGGSIDTYGSTLTRLGPLAEQAAWVVPGHGAPVSSERALEILAEDDAYLEALRSDRGSVKLPRSRSSAAQKRIHEANLGQNADNSV
jgi:glyoxylase-like metal-dependent hydrolase (beta-lactamase superfamily II)